MILELALEVDEEGLIAYDEEQVPIQKGGSVYVRAADVDLIRVESV